MSGTPAHPEGWPYDDDGIDWQARAEAAEAEIERWRASFAGHVYVKNEDYAQLRAEVERLTAALAEAQRRNPRRALLGKATSVLSDYIAMVDEINEFTGCVNPPISGEVYARALDVVAECRTPDPDDSDDEPEAEVAPLVALLRRALPLRHRQPECALIPCTCGVEALAADIRAALNAHEERR